LNQGRFLEETIRSVLTQEGNFSIDYILVDGGSTDDSIAIVKKYESLLLARDWSIRCRDIRFRWLSERDNGQSDAINKGLRMPREISWVGSTLTTSMRPVPWQRFALHSQASPVRRRLWQNLLHRRVGRAS